MDLHFTNPISFLFIVGVGFILISFFVYLISRLVSHAIFKTYQAHFGGVDETQENNKENQRPNEKALPGRSTPKEN